LELLELLEGSFGTFGGEEGGVDDISKWRLYIHYLTQSTVLK
jgi:hypothetical protein